MQGINPLLLKAVASIPSFCTSSTLAMTGRHDRILEISAEEVYGNFEDSVELSSSLLMKASTNLPGIFLVAVSPSEEYLQVCSWPRTSFGSKGINER